MTVPETVSATQPHSSTTLESGTTPKQDFVQILQPPTFISNNTQISVEYWCNSHKQVGLEVSIWTEVHINVVVFFHSWKCIPRTDSHLIENVTVELGKEFAYSPGHFNRNPVFIDKTLIQVWVVDSLTWLRHLRGTANHLSVYAHASAKASYRTTILPPLVRPDYPLPWCLSWWKELQTQQPYLPQCPWESGKDFFNSSIPI